MTWDEALQAHADPTRYPAMSEIVPLCYAEAGAAITAALAALAEAGYRVVPREATEEMLSAGWKEVGAMKQGQHGWKRICADSYRAMYDAAPAFTEGA